MRFVIGNWFLRFSGLLLGGEVGEDEAGGRDEEAALVGVDLIPRGGRGAAVEASGEDAVIAVKELGKFFSRDAFIYGHFGFS